MAVILLPPSVTSRKLQMEQGTQDTLYQLSMSHVCRGPEVAGLWELGSRWAAGGPRDRSRGGSPDRREEQEGVADLAGVCSGIRVDDFPGRSTKDRLTQICAEVKARGRSGVDTHLQN